MPAAHGAGRRRRQPDAEPPSRLGASSGRSGVPSLAVGRMAPVDDAGRESAESRGSVKRGGPRAGRDRRPRRPSSPRSAGSWSELGSSLSALVLDGEPRASARPPSGRRASRSRGIAGSGSCANAAGAGRTRPRPRGPHGPLRACRPGGAAQACRIRNAMPSRSRSSGSSRPGALPDQRALGVSVAAALRLLTEHERVSCSRLMTRNGSTRARQPSSPTRSGGSPDRSIGLLSSRHEPGPRRIQR